MFRSVFMHMINVTTFHFLYCIAVLCKTDNLKCTCILFTLPLDVRRDKLNLNTVIFTVPTRNIRPKLWPRMTYVGTWGCITLTILLSNLQITFCLWQLIMTTGESNWWGDLPSKSIFTVIWTLGIRSMTQFLWKRQAGLLSCPSNASSHLVEATVAESSNPQNFTAICFAWKRLAF